MITQIPELTEDENMWLSRVLSNLYITYDYVISWHLRETFGNTTPQINYQLNKLVKKGYLTKEASSYCTQYHLTDKSKILKK